MRTRADDHVSAAELAPGAVWQRGLYGLWTYEACGTEDKLRSALLVFGEMRVDQARDHRAFAVTDGRHINSEAVSGDPELLTPAHVRGNLCRVNDVLAGKTGDVRA